MIALFLFKIVIARGWTRVSAPRNLNRKSFVVKSC